MSDELLSGGAMSLEGPAETVGPISTPAEPEAVAAEPEGDDADPAGTIQGAQGVSFIPKQALVEARQQARTAKENAKALTAEVETLRQKAQEFDRLNAYVEQARPIIEAVSKRPDLYQQAQQPAPVAAGPLSEDEAVEFAKDLDLYTPEGKPDTGRAQRIAARNDRIAQRQTEAAMQPMRQDAASRQSAEMFNRVAAIKDAYGQTTDPDVLRQVWQVVPAELSARPEVASILQRVALAETLLQGKHKGVRRDAPPPPALQTESLGQGGQAAPKFSAVDESFAKAAGISQKDFEKTAGKYVPGAVNRLE